MNQQETRASKIRHTPSTIGAAASQPSASTVPAAAINDELSELQVVDGGGGGEAKEIRAFGPKKRHEDEWDRTPNTTGTGAIHVKTFHSKITEDALRYMDQQINEWLDAHPQYEVKFVTSSIGEFTGKIKEPHVICQVWV